MTSIIVVGGSGLLQGGGILAGLEAGSLTCAWEGWVAASLGSQSPSEFSYIVGLPYHKTMGVEGTAGPGGPVGWGET